jgi:hypothetical protein
MGTMALEGVPKVPLSDDHGIDRGTPVVRAYIEEFLGRHRNAITGSVCALATEPCARRAQC